MFSIPSVDDHVSSGFVTDIIPRLQECASAAMFIRNRDYCAQCILDVLKSEHYDPDTAKFVLGMIVVDDEMLPQEKMHNYTVAAALDATILLYPNTELVVFYKELYLDIVIIGETMLQMYMRQNPVYTALPENIPCGLSSWLSMVSEETLCQFVQEEHPNISEMRFPFGIQLHGQGFYGTLDDCAYDKMRYTILGDVFEALKNSAHWNYVVGGAVCAALCKSGECNKHKDIDVVNINAYTQKSDAIDDLFENVIPKIRINVNEKHSQRYIPVIYKTKGVITFVMLLGAFSKPILKIQFLLRPYKSLYQVLTSFDLGPTKGAYCVQNESFYVMESFLRCVHYNCVIPNPSAQTSVLRFKRYHERGFNFVIPKGIDNKYYQVLEKVDSCPISQYYDLLKQGNLASVFVLAQLEKYGVQQLKNVMGNNIVGEFAYADRGIDPCKFLCSPKWIHHAQSKGIIWYIDHEELDTLSHYNRILSRNYSCSYVEMKNALLNDKTVLSGDPCERMHVGNPQGSFYKVKNGCLYYN